MAAYRNVGPFNGVLPAATSQVIGFMRDPKRMPFLEYTQMVPAPLDGNGLFRYPILEPDEPTRITSINEYAWGFDDPMPHGKDFELRVTWTSGQTGRYAFPYTIGERTVAGWQKGANMNLPSLYDRIRLNQAMTHRANRVVNAIRGYSWPAYNTSTLAALLGVSGVYFDKSSGQEYLPSGSVNPNFQIIKNTLNFILRRIDTQTNGALKGEDEFIMIVSPKMAQALSQAGEIVNFLKQAENAQSKLMTRNGKWLIPDFYAGWKIVVEDTLVTSIRMNADGVTMADPSQTNPVQKGYLWNDDSIAFVSRPGGLDGNYGFQNFSTVQMYTFDGPGSQALGMGDGEIRAGTYVKSKQDSWDEVLHGAIVVEDVPLIAAPLSGFYLTNTMSY